MENIELIIKQIEEISFRMRLKALKMAFYAGVKGAHLGGGLSLIEIMAVLYKGILKVDSKNPEWDGRDRLILSKGHGVLAYYTALEEAGFLDEKDIDEFETDEGVLKGHPTLNIKKGIESSSGSLGMGLSLGIGIALAAKKDNKDFRTFVIMGDGECNEGSVWEAAISASNFKLGNLVGIIDNNRLQYDGETKDIMDMKNMGEKWRSFGWQVFEVDGHSVEQLYRILKEVDFNSEVPHMIIANTVKGKGVSFMENKKEWHHSILSKKQYEEVLKELGGEI